MGFLRFEKVCISFILRWTRDGEVSVVEFEWGGAWLGWRLGEEREIIDLGLLTQMKISKDLFLRPKSPSLFHLSKALKSLSQIMDLEKSLKLSLGSMVVKWWLARWSVGVIVGWVWRWCGLQWLDGLIGDSEGAEVSSGLPPISHRSMGLY